jgi:hypothetical protein
MCLASVVLQVFNLEALTNPNITVAGALLHVRPPGFATDRQLPLNLQQQQQTQLLITPGQPNCKPFVRNSIWQQRRLAEEPHIGNAYAAVNNHNAGQFGSVAAAPGPACVEEQQLPAGQKQVVVPLGHSAESIAKLLSDYTSVDWLHFTNVTAAFNGFKEKESQQAFEGLLSTVVAEWCCRSSTRVMQAGAPHGHLHQVRPWGSQQRFCAKRLDIVDKVYSFFC